MELDFEYQLLISLNIHSYQEPITLHLASSQPSSPMAWIQTRSLDPGYAASALPTMDGSPQCQTGNPSRIPGHITCFWHSLAPCPTACFSNLPWPWNMSDAVFLSACFWIYSIHFHSSIVRTCVSTLDISMTVIPCALSHSVSKQEYAGSGIWAKHADWTEVGCRWGSQVSSFRTLQHHSGWCGHFFLEFAVHIHLLLPNAVN